MQKRLVPQNTIGERPGVPHDKDEEPRNLFYSDLITHNKQGWPVTEAFLKQVVEILLKYLKDCNDREKKILDFSHPKELLEKFDFNIDDDPQDLQKILDACAESLKHQVKTSHPRFFNQLSTGLDIISLAGEWLTAVANTNMFTYEIAPCFILMENQVIKKMCSIVGWEEGDGIFAPGRGDCLWKALSFVAPFMLTKVQNRLARKLDRTENQIINSQNKRNLQSHYSMRGAAAVTGVGVDNCISIPVDDNGCMIPEALEEEIVKAIQMGGRPFFVAATAGTTVYGAFDPINSIADVCEKHKLWLHVDAAWGGGLLLSGRHRVLLSGIERANSVTWNPHKLMGALLQCSACLFRQEGLLFQCNQMSADYLFQQDKPYDVSYDTGDKAIQCGRHNDIFKLWLMWKAKGMKGFEAQVDRLMKLANYFTARLKETEGYEMVKNDPQYVNICFWYVPSSLRNLEEKEKRARLEKIAPKIKAKMMERGSTMVGYQPDKDLPNFFRMIISNPATTRSDLDFLVQEIIDIGESL